MCLQLAMPTNKQKKRRLLPNLEETQLLLSQDQATVKVVEDAFCSLKHTKNLNSFASERLKHVDRDAIFTWLIAHYGSKDLFSIMQRIEDLPKSLTKYQAIALLKQFYGRITENDWATIFTLLTEYCDDIVKGAVARKRKLFKFELRNVVILEFNLWENIARNVYYTRLFYTARGVYTRSHYTYSKY